MEEIKTEDYHIGYDAQTAILFCKGSLRLSGMKEYAPVVQFFHQVVEAEPPLLKFNLRGLEFLNSSGINVLSKFIIKVRQKKSVAMLVQGSLSIPWQSKSLKNLRRLMPTLELEWE
jgi:hypothetical protein